MQYTPSVIEPSFGVGRIIWAILEHAFTTKKVNGEERQILSLAPSVAPVKVFVLSVMVQPVYEAMVDKVMETFIGLNIAAKTDNSGASIGRRYARADEIGTPYVMTIDELSPKNQDITIRDRDTFSQIRLPIEQAVEVVRQLVSGQETWAAAYDKYPRVNRDENSEN